MIFLTALFDGMGYMYVPWYWYAVWFCVWFVQSIVTNPRKFR